MTDEQIKQNAEEYAEKHAVRIDGGGWEEEYDYDEQEAAFIAGAHSRDEEITGYQMQINMTADALQQCMDELKQLRNPWISVKDHLPEMFVDSEGITHDFSVKVLVTNKNNPNYWHVAEYYPDKNEWCCLEHPTYVIDNVTHWMPVLTF